jgi:hypothetical protein
VGHISLDGTKMKANASKHKAMSYSRITDREKELEKEVARLLDEADAVDAEEDRMYGKGIGDELPEELSVRETRLKKIRESKKKLEERTKKKTGDEPKPNDQINFTDAESRIMKDSAMKEFIQGYNAQCAVDDAMQIIVAASVTTETNDVRQIKPMITAIEENLDCLPKELSADAGYFSEENIIYLQMRGIKAFIPPDRMRHTDPVVPCIRGEGYRRTFRSKTG